MRPETKAAEEGCGGLVSGPPGPALAGSDNPANDGPPPNLGCQQRRVRSIRCESDDNEQIVNPRIPIRARGEAVWTALFCGG